MSNDLALTILAIGVVVSIGCWVAFKVGERFMRWYHRRHASRYADPRLR